MPDNLEELSKVECCPDVEKLLDNIGGRKAVLRQIPDADLDQVISEIAEHLLPSPDSDLPHPIDANLVIMVHGFNNPRCSALKMFVDAAKAVLEDDTLQNRAKLVCIGYRWPSEKMWTRGNFSALPRPPFWLFWLSVAVIVAHILFVFSGTIDRTFAEWLPVPHSYITQFVDTHEILRSIFAWSGDILRVFTWPAIAVFGVVVVGMLQRAVVYFRDIYRATNFGVPDLVDVIRDIDFAVWERARKLKISNRNRIALSLIGHSMGGLVVTNVIRILSDVFDPRSLTRSFGGVRLRWNGTRFVRLEGEGESPREERVPGDIGHVFKFMRLVLVAPDIPAEALIGNRANFLKSSLRQLEEAYLFSNEGDEVLRLISTWANYSSFPTNSWCYGYRLGNVEIKSEEYGTIPSIKNEDLPEKLRVGNNTIIQLTTNLKGISPNLKCISPKEVAASPHLFGPVRTFSYFDCTDCVDCIDGGNEPQPLLTFARRHKLKEEGKIGRYEHVGLLATYLLGWPFYINVHGGYFEGKTLRRLIYRLACRGYDDTMEAYAAQVCKDSQIKARFAVPPRRDPPTASSIVLETIEELEEKTKKLENEKLELNAKLEKCQLELNKRVSGVDVDDETGKVSIGTFKLKPSDNS